jgi:DNA-binding NarL/FixJ family response regulator
MVTQLLPMTTAERRGVKVALVDDHHVVREGLRMLLGGHDDIEVVGEASDAEGAFALLASDTGRPDIVVLDVTLGVSDGIAILPALRARWPQVKFLILTMHHDAEAVRQALANGAAGYLVKGAYSSELLLAIRAVAHGERYVHSSIASRLIDDYLRAADSQDILTEREREVLALFAGGGTAAAIGRVLGISTHTVRRHVANLRTKLGLHGRIALARYAAEHGMAPRGELTA